MSDKNKTTAERVLEIESVLVKHANAWCLEVDATGGEFVVCLLALATRCQIAVGKTAEECATTARRVANAVAAEHADIMPPSTCGGGMSN